MTCEDQIEIVLSYDDINRSLSGRNTVEDNMELHDIEGWFYVWMLDYLDDIRGAHESAK